MHSIPVGLLVVVVVVMVALVMAGWERRRCCTAGFWRTRPPTGYDAPWH